MSQRTRHGAPSPVLVVAGVGVLGWNLGLAAFDLSEGIAQAAKHVAVGVAAASVFACAATRPCERTAWLLVGAGLLLWTIADQLGELTHAGLAGITFSPRVALFLGFYVFLLAGVRQLGGRVTGEGSISGGVVIALVGLATLWAWATSGGPVNLTGDRFEAVSIALAYVLFDIVLLCSGVVGLASQRWRDGTFLMLTLAFALMLILDSVLALEEYVTSDLITLDPMAPIALLLVGVAPWAFGERERQGLGGRTLPIVLSAVGVVFASGVLVWDHFDRLGWHAIVLAAITLIGAAAYLLHIRTAQAQIEGLHTASTEAALDCILTWDSAGRIVEWNPACERTFGYAGSEAIGEDFAELVVPDSLRGVFRQHLQSASGGDTSLLNRRLETTALDIDRNEFPVEVAVSRVPHKRVLFTAYIRDISERKQREEQNVRLANIVRSSAEAIYSVDLERRITAWNDAAERLYGFTKTEAVGKKHIVHHLVPVDRVAETGRLLEDIRAGHSVTLETQRRRKDGVTVDVKLRGYPIKDPAGRTVGMSFVAEDISDRAWRHAHRIRQESLRSWTAALDRAIARDELVFFAQPVVALGTGEVHHSELLARMYQEGKLLEPGQFLPPLEESGAVRHLDRWAIDAGIALAARRPVAINLSAMSLNETHLVGHVAARLGAHCAPPGNVVFEITESAAAANLEAAAVLVSGLRSLGCEVSLDDFGTGFGSFTYLKHLPVSELKIDMEFVRGLRRNVADHRVVRSILGVARNFSMRTVAEGVEDQETCDELREMGVDCAQGILFGGPRPLNSTNGRSTHVIT